jgi:poly-gamma-glutamate capsule biosynthesis protein CapA/YwtB (metallophosphatase superfamily)
MKIMVCGDIALCREAERMIIEGSADQIAGDLRQCLREADIFLANLECPLTDCAKPQWDHFPTLRGAKIVGKFLGELGVDIASLANNHIADYGREGLRDTISVLEEQGIAWVGAGLTQEEANRPFILERAGLRVGILALAQPEVSAAKHGKWGAAVLEDESALDKIKELKESVDFAIAYLHFGVEFFEYPTPHQIRLSRRLVEAGAGLVLGHHSHTAQGYEYYRDGFIAYGLGNFIFDMPPDRRRYSRLGILLQVDLDGTSLRNVDIIPVDTSYGRTKALKGQNGVDAGKYLGELSQVLKDKTELRERYYHICLDNLRIHLHSLVHYGVYRLDKKRMVSWASAQRWPQIMELRRDLLRFMISGEAREFEKRRETRSTEWAAAVWRAICLLLSIVGCRWGKRLSVKHDLQQIWSEG